jgi:hypothetical protein
MGSAAVVPPPPRGLRRLYHLTATEFAISAIVFKRLKVARFSNLNDPFELLARSAIGFYAGLMVNKNKMDKEAGLLCFSEDWTDPVLWTHYAARHTGICLGFDIADGLAKKVTYQSDRLKDEIASKNENEIIDLLLHTKFESWRYEREWRVFINLRQAISEGPLQYYSFSDKLKLVEVILGADCTLEVGTIRELLATHHPQVSSVGTRLALASFAIVPNERTIVSVPQNWEPGDDFPR